MDERLARWISTYLKQGYDAQTLRKSLIAQGYSQEDVDTALAAAQQGVSPSKGMHAIVEGHSHLLIIFGLTVLIFALVGTGIFLFFFEGSDNSSKIDPFKPRGNTGELSEGEKRTERVDLTNPPPPPEAENKKEESQEDDETPPNDEIETKSEYKLVVVDNERARIETQVEELASDYPDEAADLCPSISTTSGTDWCYSFVAISSQQERFCSFVTAGEKRDLCYLQFPTEQIGSILICDNIVSSVYKSSCQKMYSLYGSSPTADANPFVSYDYN